MTRGFKRHESYRTDADRHTVMKELLVGDGRLKKSFLPLPLLNRRDSSCSAWSMRENFECVRAR